MPKFFLPPEQIHESFLTLTGDNAAHAKVLRLKPGDQVTVCDGNGTDYDCTISDVSNGLVSLVVHRKDASCSEPACFVTVFMAFAKGDKLEHVIQKATELGASRIVAFPARRCVCTPDPKSLARKLERWNKIAASAAEQSGRGRIPQVITAASYQQALTLATQADLAVCFYENEDRYTFRQAVEQGPFSSAALLTGPEGGFTPEEIQQAQAAGLKICTLGSRILRCETAPLCALSALMYATGEF